MSTVNRKLRVFLCHSSIDKKFVYKLYMELINEGWLDVWYDDAKLLPGQDWETEITNGLRVADVVIICLSEKTVKNDGYIHKEMQLALSTADEKPDGTIFIIPLRIDDCSVPSRLEKWQWVDAFPFLFFGYEILLQALMKRADELGISTRSNLFDILLNVHASEGLSLKYKALTKSKVSIFDVYTIPSNGFWGTDSSFDEIRRKAAKEGHKVQRIFILPKTFEMKYQTLNKQVLDDESAGIKTYIALENDIPREAIHDFEIFDNEVVSDLNLVDNAVKGVNFSQDQKKIREANEWKKQILAVSKPGIQFLESLSSID